MFISFEGSEGCGKSTQIELLRQRLQSMGESCLLVREPGGTTLGEAVRELLLRQPADEDPINPQAELLLFAASRAQLVREKIAPALGAGIHVVADRFMDSTTVYQGFGRGLDLLEVSQINRFAIGAWRPDVTFLLDMDAALAHSRALERSQGTPDRMESESADFYDRIRDGYLRMAREDRKRVVVLPADATQDALATRIWEEVERRLQAR
ncbi:MAG: dTMP kinase [Verrucomicrobiales bacterium]